MSDYFFTRSQYFGTLQVFYIIFAFCYAYRFTSGRGQLEGGRIIFLRLGGGSTFRGASSGSYDGMTRRESMPGGAGRMGYLQEQEGGHMRGNVWVEYLCPLSLSSSPRDTVMRIHHIVPSSQDS